MTGRHFYFRQKRNKKNSENISVDNNDCDDLLYPDHDDDDIDDDEEEVDKDEDSEFLQDIPYSSSSIDRSSIGSIPWADDAIKKNKQDWDRVERMLCGEESLPTEEADLRLEIEDWQRKFPQLMGKKAKVLKQQSFDSSLTANNDDFADVETISNVSLNSLDDNNDGNDNDDNDGFLTPTPTVERQKPNNYRTQDIQDDVRSTNAKNYFLQPSHDDLSSLLDRDLRISSVKLRQRNGPFSGRRHSPMQQMTTQFLVAPLGSAARVDSTMPNTNSANVPRGRLRMPPILNVLDSNRRFRGLLNNRSFVQLTQVQEMQQQQQQQHNQKRHQRMQQQQPHAKSAALTHHASAERRQTQYGHSNRFAWHVPIVASRFFNNRNSIVLPAINRRHRVQDTTTTTASLSNSSGADGGGVGLGGISHRHYSNSSSFSSGNNGGECQQPHQAFITRQHFNGPTAAAAATNSSTTPSTGRSISAAVHHPRTEYLASTFYIPYSASKFKAFK